MIWEWFKWYLECGWLWVGWGLQVAWVYATAYLTTYGPGAIPVAEMVFDFWLFLIMGQGIRILRKAATQCSI
jgi:hypothetical protein